MIKDLACNPWTLSNEEPLEEYRSLWKVDRVLAIHSLSSTDSQSSSNIPFPWHLLLGFNSQAQERQSFYNPSPGKEKSHLLKTSSISNNLLREDTRMESPKEWNLPAK